MTDWVAIASYLTVAVAAIIIIFFGIKGYNLIYKDSNKK